VTVVSMILVSSILDCVSPRNLGCLPLPRKVFVTPPLLCAPLYFPQYSSAGSTSAPRTTGSGASSDRGRLWRQAGAASAGEAATGGGGSGGRGRRGRKVAVAAAGVAAAAAPGGDGGSRGRRRR